MSFENALKNTVLKFRKQFADCDAAYLSITITIDGPVDHGDLLIKYRIGESSYGDESVSGADLEQCATEYFRRKGWKRHNEYVSLPYFERDETND